MARAQFVFTSGAEGTNNATAHNASAATATFPPSSSSSSPSFAAAIILASAVLSEEEDGGGVGDGAGLLPAAVNNLAVATLYAGEALKVRW